jgi:hypothetical protein
MVGETVKLKVGPIWNDGETQAKREAALGKVAQANAGHTVSFDGNRRIVVGGRQSECCCTVED